MAGLEWFLVVCYEKVVIDLLIEVEIGKGVLIGRFILQYLFQLLDIEFADGVQVLVDLSHDDLFLFAEGLAISDAFGECEFDGLMQVFLN